MRLYHASTLCIEKPDVLHSRDKLDFGRGLSDRYARPSSSLCGAFYAEGQGSLRQCILNGQMLDRHLHFIEAKKV